MRTVPVPRLLFLLFLPALLCAAPATGWAAPTITWYRIHHLAGEWTDMSGSPRPFWNRRVGMRVRPNSSAEAVRSVTITVDGRERTNENWRPAPDGTGEVCFCTDWDEATLPPAASYRLVAYDLDGAASEAVVTPALAYLEPIPEVISPAPGGVTSETAPTFTWLPYPGFAGEGAPPVERQGVGVSDDAWNCVWQRCDIAPGETSAMYGGSEPLQPGRIYWGHFLECAPTVVLERTPEGAVFGEYVQETGQLFAFAIYSPVPVIQSMYVDRGPVLDWNGWSSYFEEVGLSVSDLDWIVDIASVTVTDSRGQAHQAELVNALGLYTYTAEYRWAAWGQDAPSPAGTYTVTVTDWEGHVDSASGVVSELPPDLPVIVTPEANCGLSDEAPVFSWTAPEGAGCFCMGAAEQDAWPGSTWSPPGPVTSPLSYEGDALLPGHVYDWFLNYHVFDGVQEDPRVTCRFRPTVTGRFLVYSPVPVIQSADICRGRCLCADPGSTESYHEGARISVLDCDGWQDVSVSTVTPDGLVLPDVAECDGSTNDGHYTLTQANAHNPASVGEGSYIITATDTAGSTVSLTSGHVSAGVPPQHEITSPTNNAVLPEGDLTPTFSWTGATGAAYSCVCVLDRTAGDTVLWVRRSIPGDVTSVVYNDDGSATVPRLSPGGRYLVKVRAHYPDEDPGDGVTVDTFTGTAANFYTYSPPAISHATINRGRDRDACEEICYHQEAQVLLVGIADPADVTVTVTAPGDDEPHQASFKCQPGPQTVAFCWQSCGHPSPLPPGTYTVTMADSAGRTDSVSIQVSDIPDNTPVLQVPADDSVTSALPSFLWSGPADVCYCVGVGVWPDACRLWCGGRYVSGSTGTATYNDNGAAPPLNPGGCYRWGVRPTIPDLPQSDPRASSAFTPRAFARFWVEPKFVGLLEPINDDGSSIFKLSSTVPVKFQLIAADGSQVTDAGCQLHVAKVTDDILGMYEEAVSTSAADSGNSFRYVDDHYQFNLGTAVLGVGTYRLRVTVNGVTAHETTISLR